ncbi:MAG TPA: hypothetical protein VMH02_01630 [Verrucomicrobiae bacterium]|nr:hypothetical protein [Verrucomicrobiae bacterium]
MAILLAGLWALYVFVYDNHIRPSLAAPTPSFTVAMRHAGNDGGLAVIRLDETIRNPGPAEVNFLGYSITVIGSKIAPLASPRLVESGALESELAGYGGYSEREPVYRNAFVTAQGAPKSGEGLLVEPGQTTTIGKEFYVPRRRFDHLTAWLVAVYTRSEGEIPTTLTIEPSGLPRFRVPENVPTVFVSTPIAELDLKAE